MTKLSRFSMLAVGATLLALGLLAACAGGADEQAREMPMDDHPEAGPERVIHVHAENVKFEPNTIRVKRGETIRVVLDNHDAFLHDYTTDEAEFIVHSVTGAEHTEHESVMPEGDHEMGEQVSLQPLHVAAEGNEHTDLVFQATEPGEFEFYCSVAGHKEVGMVGTIVVTE